MTAPIYDPVYISNKYMVFSNHHNDILFNENNFKLPIFCAGFITEIGNEVYNLKIGDFIGYISPIQARESTLSSNLTVKIANEANHNLITILPYASFAMNILRRINPKLSQKIMIVGKNFFTILLKKLIDLSGANVFFMTSKDEYDDLPSRLDCIIFSSDAVDNDLSYLKEIKGVREFGLEDFNIFDMGLDDPLYKRGIKYPYSYIRWHFKNNLEYFINLVEKSIIKLDFFQFLKIKTNSVKEMNEYIDSLKDDSLVLFALQD